MMKSRFFAVVLVALLCFGFILPGIGAAAEAVRWHNYDEGLALGKQQKKKILVHFYADWCGYCRKMAHETFEASEVVSYVNKHFVPVRVDIDKEKETAAGFGIRGVPATWFLTEAAKRIGNVPGLVPPDRFLSLLKQVAAMPPEKAQTKRTEP
jgi:thioredoxin-related protein